MPEVTPGGLIEYAEARRLMGNWKEARFKQWVHRHHVPTFPHPTNRSKKMVRVSDLTPEAQKRRAEERVRAALADPGAANAEIARSEPRHPFALMPPVGAADTLSDRSPAAVPAAQRKLADMWSDTWRLCANGKWRAFDGKRPFPEVDVTVDGPGTMVAAVAGRYKISRSKVYDGLKQMRLGMEGYKGKSSEGRFTAGLLAVLPKRRTGRRSIFNRPEPEYRWMFEFLRHAYLNQARYSERQAWWMLCEEARHRQREWKLGHSYEVPTLRQVRIALRDVPVPEKVLNRLGRKAYNDRCAPYISRDPGTLKSNDIWVTDQKQMDVRLRGDGEKLGRIWMVSFLDVRSFKVMGYWFGPVLSSDMVISAAAVAIGRHGAPRSILMDLGKEFACTAFSGSFRKIKGETLLRDAEGLCQRLGTDVIKAIGRNPQTKPIERWHREAARFDHRIPGWCGSNTQERPEVLKELERQHEEWKQRRRPSTPLWTIQQYLHEFVSWIENEWNARHRGRGKHLRGMTPNECWNTHLPPKGPRRITPVELELATADHRVLKVARGGQVNITLYGQTIEYQAPELFLRQGEHLEVIIGRRSLRKITVLDRAEDGRFLCEAVAKPLFHWGRKAPEDREELRQAIRMRNAARKAISRGNAARRVLEVTATPTEIGPQRPPMREISSTEFKARRLRALRVPKTQTSGELAREVFGEEDL